MIRLARYVLFTLSIVFLFMIISCRNKDAVVNNNVTEIALNVNNPSEIKKDIEEIVKNETTENEGIEEIKIANSELINSNWKNPKEKYDDIIFIDSEKFSILRTNETRSMLLGKYRISENGKEIVLYNFEINDIPVSEEQITLRVLFENGKIVALMNDKYEFNYYKIKEA